MGKRKRRELQKIILKGCDAIGRGVRIFQNRESKRDRKATRMNQCGAEGRRDLRGSDGEEGRFSKKRDIQLHCVETTRAISNRKPRYRLDGRKRRMRKIKRRGRRGLRR